VIFVAAGDNRKYYAEKGGNINTQIVAGEFAVGKI
jgi:hypothetical protein